MLMIKRLDFALKHFITAVLEKTPADFFDSPCSFFFLIVDSFTFTYRSPPLNGKENVCYGSTPNIYIFFLV